ncbi:hypothetical protein [Metabacillus halosaccharovorans]|uniref:hypothetical protein n=1 Tax=Metabacillus halosaccharovorans TaxID=930124 RepID=UPI001C1F29FE|nr:hypothetical protein [Metabacillus halosaccharovorans]MBU7595362.1 hypothetical protein [Metabacillus halosaccharovorans]
MAEELRNIFNQDFMNQLSKELKNAYPSFDQEIFLTYIYAGEWDNLTLKQRVRRISECFHETINLDFPEVVNILKKVASHFEGSLTGIIFPDYIEVYGLNDWDVSISALEYFTQYSTSEFAVRPFVVKDQEKMLQQFIVWSTHSNEHVRRLASEGSRPRLPWGMVLTGLKNDPSPILPILENLKADPSLYVRKSVANNINDISRDHPAIVLSLAKKWNGENDLTNWILKKGLRTLLKKGNLEALELFGLGPLNTMTISDLDVTKNVKIGDAISFSFQLASTDSELRKVRVEYTIDFIKANGKPSSKQFQLSEVTIKPGEKKQYVKMHSFKDLTTRKHYPGRHVLSIIVNGEVKGTKPFDVHLQ